MRALAEQKPLVVAIDDVQWLDPASASALAYAGRRLRAERVGVLASRRGGLESTLLDELRRSLPRERFTHTDVGPLAAGALHRVVQDQLGVVLPRPLLVEVHEAAGGNPFYALEIVRMLRRSGVSVEAGQPLPVPESLHELVHGRLLALSPESRDYLLAAAALSQPTVSIVEAATGVRRGDGLAPALEAHVVELDGDRIRFTHPLLAAGAYELADPRRRSEIHARLAELVENPETRAWQLAASVDEPDDVVAAALEDAALRARARGAPRPAGLLLERSAALTPATDELARKRRALAAAAAHHEAGDTDRARALLEPALEQAPPGPERAAALVALARVRSYDDELRGALALFEQAVAEAEPASLVEGIAQEGLAGMLFRLREDLARSVEASARAAEIGRAHDSVELVAEALGTKATSEAALGRPDAAETSQQAMALQSSCAHRPILRQPRFAVAVVQFWHDDLVGTHRSYTDMAAHATELGDESSMPYIRVMLGQIDCAFGRFDNAMREADEGQVLAEQAGQRTLLGYVLAIRAVAEAHLGRVDDATASATRALELARETSGAPAWIFASWALGHLALSRGDPVGALRTLEPLLEHHRREAIVEPGAVPFMADCIEALVEAGRVDDAREALDGFQTTAERLERGRGMAAARRCRGLLVAAANDLLAALAELQAAVSLSRRQGHAVRARTLVARTRRGAATREAPARVARDARGGARYLRADRRRALGRTGSGRVAPDQRSRSNSGSPYARRGACRGSRCRRKDEPRGRGSSLLVGAHGRGAPLACLREARCPFAD